MAWYRCVGSNGGGGGSQTISLANNYRIGVSPTTAKLSPLDANNYITVSGNVVTYHRNNVNYGLWIYTPLLTAGKVYAFSCDEITNSDKYFYLDYATTISTTGDTTITRLGQIVPQTTAVQNAGRGFVFEAPNDGYYGMVFWSNNTDDISVTNPCLTEIG